MDVRPNLVDRLFLLLDGLQGPSSMNLYTLTLDAMPDLAALRAAVAGLLVEQPLLRTRVTPGRLGYARRAVDHEPVENVLTIGEAGPGVGFDSPAERDFMRARVDLTARPPFRVLVRPHPEGARLVMAIHHSVADGIGGYFALDRLAAHYAAQVTGEPLDPPPADVPPRSYASYFAKLTPAQRRRALLNAARSFHELVFPDVDCATFGDLPLPSRGEFSWREVALPREWLPALKARARELDGTLNDLMLSAVARAGALTWPDPAGKPHQVMVPASMRDGPAVDPTNRVAELRFGIPAACLGATEAIVAHVRTQTPLARDRARAFATICQNALVSRLPPSFIRDVVAKSLETPRNQTLTFVFSNTGVLDPQPRDFGPIRALALGGTPPLTMPPGLGVVAATSRGTVNLTITWCDPAVAVGSIDRFVATLMAELSRLAAPVRELSRLPHGWGDPAEPTDGRTQGSD